MVVFRFDAALAALTAAQFIGDRLIAALRIAGAVTGEDFTFGRAKGGNIGCWLKQGQAHGFSGDAVGPVALDGEPVSSSRIRDLLRAGDMRECGAAADPAVRDRGLVQHGDKLGRTIGYPTANIDMGKYLRPAYGIYAVRGRLADGRVLDGAANLGVRPTFDPPKELLEPYFFDFAGDLYGECVEVELIEWLRAEAKFDTLDALTAQMAADCARAREILSARGQ